MMNRRSDFRFVRMIVAVVIVGFTGGIAWFAYDRFAAASTASSAGITTLVEVKDSGSTNVIGWDLTIRTDGSGVLVYTSSGSTHSAKPSAKEFASKTFNADLLKNDLESTNLSSFVDHCMRSVSLGSSEVLIYNSKILEGFDCYASVDPDVPLVVAIDEALKTVGLK